MPPPTKTTSLKRASSSAFSYTEILDPNFEPPHEEVEEFAKRIGIDVPTEPHLLHLSREGLKEGLPPNWKPCLDSTRNAWYYHDTTSKNSQWEHPLDAVYRQKVTSARSDHAMDRIQNFDPLTVRPMLKSLPPLKKGGGSLAPLALPPPNGKSVLLGPLAPPPNRLAPLGPLKAIGKLQPMPAQHRPQPPPSTPMPLEGGKKLTPPTWLSDADEGIDALRTKPGSEESDSSFGRAIAKPKILLPSASSPLSSNGCINGESISRTSVAPEAELLQKPTSESIHCPSSSSPHFLPLDSSQWNQLTHLKPLEEEDLLENVNFDGGKSPIRAKGNVRFNLEDDLDFKFDTSSRGSERSSEEEESEESSENTSEEEDMNSKSDDDKSEAVTNLSGTNGIPQNTLLTHLGKKPLTISTIKPPIPSPVRPTATKMTPMNSATPGDREAKLMGAGEKNLSKETESEKEKERMRLNMEDHLHLFRRQLNEEQGEREAQIQTQLQGQLAKIELENEAIIQKRTLELEKTMKATLEKSKEEQGENLKKELETLELDYQLKIEEAKIEVEKSNEAMVNEINELVKLEKERLLAEKKRELLVVVEKEVTQGIEALRHSLLAEQKKQIDELRASHDHFMESLVQDFRREEEAMRETHKSHIDDLRLTFSIEKGKIIESFQTEQTTEIEKLKLTNEQPSQGKQEAPLPNNASTNHGVVLPTLEENERELANTKLKYKMLQEKYALLKSELTKVVSIEKSRILEDRHRQTSEDYENQSFSVGDETSSESVNDPTIQNDRLSRALGALESLRDQILDMNDEEGPTATKQLEKKEVSAQRIEKEQKKDNFSGRKKSKQKLNVYPSNTNRITQVPRTPPHDLEKQVSRDRRHHESIAQLKIVKEAKAFIKSQRHRLDKDLDLEDVGFDSKRSYKDLLNQSEATESSGFGSLTRSTKSLKSPTTRKTPVGKDIEGILSSLRKLDSQMQSLWTMVGQQQIQGHGYLTPLIHPTSPAALAQFHIMKENGAMDPLVTKTAHPLITNAELRTRYTITPPNQSGTSAVVPDLSLLNNLVFNQNSKHALSDERQKFEASQERLWKTYGPSDDSVIGKTKELRDWLRKF